MGIEALLLSQVITITGSTGQVVTRQADGSLALEDAAGGGAESPLTLTAGSSTETPLTIDGDASQSVPLQRWRTSTGSVLVSIDTLDLTIHTGGRFIIGSGTTRIGMVRNSNSGGNLIAGFVNVVAFNASGLQVRYAGGLSWVNDANTGSAKDTGINRNLAGVVEINNGTAGNFAALRVGAPTAATVAQVVRGAAAQTANLQEWQNSAGAIIASIDNAGRVFAAPAASLPTVPQFSFSNDSNTGIGSHSGDWLTVITAGTARCSFVSTEQRYAAAMRVMWADGTDTTFSANYVGIARNAIGVLEVNNGTAGTYRDLIVRNLRMSAPTIIPASASATGAEGQTSWDADYIYICTATNTWKRVAIATW